MASVPRTVEMVGADPRQLLLLVFLQREQTVEMAVPPDNLLNFCFLRPKQSQMAQRTQWFDNDTAIILLLFL